MKRVFTLLLAVLIAPVAYAHVLLTSAYGSTGATQATAVSKSYDWNTNTVCLTYALGTATFADGRDTVFTVLTSAPTITNCISLSSGAWTATDSTGVAIGSGTLAGSGLPTALQSFAGQSSITRNAADLFAANTFLPGTQPATW